MRAFGREDWLIRTLDVLGAAILLIFILPVYALIALMVRLEDGGPVYFAQERIGRGGKRFRCLKFRSMAVDAEAQLQKLLATDPAARRAWELDRKLKDDPRITRIGKLLRTSSLDELPQLINVLRGEMSLVGPRPIVEAEVERYGRHFRKYCSIRPGLTGLWQVSGRNDVSYRERVVLDVAYVRNRCVRLYFRVLFKTIPAVLARRGSY